MFDLGIVGDSCETAVTWSNCKKLLKDIQIFWNREMSLRKIQVHNLGFRISQIYHDGVCCYFYFGFKLGTLDESYRTIIEIRKKFFDVFHAAGGSLTHHHGIGNKNKIKYKNWISEVEMKMLKAIKREIDPKNIFASESLLCNDNVDAISKL